MKSKTDTFSEYVWGIQLLENNCLVASVLFTEEEVAETYYEMCKQIHLKLKPKNPDTAKKLVVFKSKLNAVEDSTQIIASDILWDNLKNPAKKEIPHYIVLFEIVRGSIYNKKLFTEKDSVEAKKQKYLMQDCNYGCDSSYALKQFILPCQTDVINPLNIPEDKYIHVTEMSHYCYKDEIYELFCPEDYHLVLCYKRNRENPSDKSNLVKVLLFKSALLAALQVSIFKLTYQDCGVVSYDLPISKVAGSVCKIQPNRLNETKLCKLFTDEDMQEIMAKCEQFLKELSQD